MLDKQNPLGQKTEYKDSYDAALLFPIARSEKRDELDANFIQFKGGDIWNAFEISWLNEFGLPQVAVGVFEFDAASPCIIESKSFKLYLNSFNQTKFQSKAKVLSVLTNDLSEAVKSTVSINLFNLEEASQLNVRRFNGHLLDNQAISIDCYDYDPSILALDNSNEWVEEDLYSNLLKSNCLITSQPDWASIQIQYVGKKICQESLLRYIVSFRTHNEFHEQCVERFFHDIMKYCQPEKLTIYARYTRRGGLDINPWRSTHKNSMENIRLVRQ